MRTHLSVDVQNSNQSGSIKEAGQEWRDAGAQWKDTDESPFWLQFAYQYTY
jgi:hypothetical protein